ncbi:MAG: DUF2628 domain-containing protein [Hyphomicrobiaceae bacterium]|nr:DUF2628 domain-containing protein [Hyphomicrobiaceae bacterium]
MLHLLMAGRERTQSYTVHEAPVPTSDRIERAEALRFVRDGFSWQAFLWAPGWLVEHKIWTGLLGYLVSLGAIAGLDWLFDLPTIVTALLVLAVHLVIGSEADEMERAQLNARDWTTVGQVTGTGPLDCERRFFDRWLSSVPMTLSSGGAVKDVIHAAARSPMTGEIQQKSVGGLLARPVAVLGSLLAPRYRRKG